MTTTNTELSRKEFEKWCKGRHSIRRNEGGYYDHDTTDFAWLAWQAARADAVEDMKLLSRGLSESRDFICIDPENDWQNGYSRGIGQAITLISRKYLGK